LVASVVGYTVIQAQGGDAASRRRDLERVKGSIEASHERIKRLDAESQRTSEQLARFGERRSRLDSMVEAAQRQEKRLAEETMRMQSRRDSLVRELAGRRDGFVRVARSLFRQRLLTPAYSILMMPKEHAVFALRRHLFDRYASRQRRRINDIRSLADAVVQQERGLSERRAEQLRAVSRSRDEMVRLLGLQRAGEQAVERTDAEREGLAHLVQQKNAEAREIAGMIARLEKKGSNRESSPTTHQEKATPKSREARATSPERSGPRETAPERPNTERPNPERSTSERSTMEGGSKPRLAWPTSGRRVVEAFGQRVNPRTGTVTINPGVNIAAGKGSAAVASADGRVSLVSWLPSYGTIVIVEHRGGTRTVYGNLSGAHVSSGSTVRAGQTIGTVGESIDGEFLHFEVWQDGRRVNPMSVLR
jgi:septal ring factor EnvC (AmiA/AmiB activator)